MKVPGHRIGLLFCLLVLVACGQQAGETLSVPATISASELAQRLASDAAPLVLDVRSPEEFAAGHIPGAVNIPHTELAERVAELGDNRAREIVVHCRSGKRAALAEEILRQAGFRRVRDLEGHFLGWSAAGLPVVAPPAPESAVEG